MRYDISVMWVEDTPTFYEETKDILEMFAEDMGIAVQFRYVQDAQNLLENLNIETKGFKKCDIYFIDYSLSKGVVGDDIIRELRKVNVDADVLFYSSEYEKDIRNTIVDDLNSFQGVYIANKDNFEEKSNYLIKKNARRLLSLNSIRGVLMDQTSENDYTVNSYIQRKFDTLNSEHRQMISKMLYDSVMEKYNTLTDQIPELLERLEKDGITNIKRTMDLSSYLFPNKLKYIMFENMLEYNGENIFVTNTIEGYLNGTVQERNKLAHKKLDLCKTQQYILYYDTVDQYEKRQCPEDCAEHTDNNKISLENWKDIRKEVVEYGKQFDEVQKKLMDKDTE